MHLEKQTWSLCKRKINEGKCYWNQSTTQGRCTDLQLQGAGSRLCISTSFLSVCSESDLLPVSLTLIYWSHMPGFHLFLSLTETKLLFLFYDVALPWKLYMDSVDPINKYDLFQTAGSTCVGRLLSFENQIMLVVVGDQISSWVNLTKLSTSYLTS